MRRFPVPGKVGHAPCILLSAKRGVDTQQTSAEQLEKADVRISVFLSHKTFTNARLKALHSRYFTTTFLETVLLVTEGKAVLWIYFTAEKTQGEIHG